MLCGSTFQLLPLNISLGRGRIAQLDLANVDGGLALHAADETRDISAQYLIRFPPLHPNTLIERRITLKNPTYARTHTYEYILVHTVKYTQTPAQFSVFDCFMFAHYCECATSAIAQFRVRVRNFSIGRSSTRSVGRLSSRTCSSGPRRSLTRRASPAPVSYQYHYQSNAPLASAAMPRRPARIWRVRERTSWHMCLTNDSSTRVASSPSIRRPAFCLQTASSTSTLRSRQLRFGMHCTTITTFCSLNMYGTNTSILYFCIYIVDADN